MGLLIKRYEYGQKLMMGNDQVTFLERKNARKLIVRDKYGFKIEVRPGQVKPL